MSYRVLPYVYQHGVATIPDAVLREVWDEIKAAGKHRVVWYSGGVETFAEFLAFIRRPGTLPVFVVDTRQPHICFMAWLTELRDRCAKAHFCGVRGIARGMVNAVLEYWDSFTAADGSPLFAVLTGITPETNADALRLVKISGFEVVGTIPNLCNIVDENRRVGGVISYRKGK